MNFYKNKSGQVIGPIIKTVQLTNPHINGYSLLYTVEIPRIGTWTVSDQDDITYERVKAIAEYKKCCIESRILEAQDELEKLQKEIVELQGKIKDIDKATEVYKTEM